MPVVRPFSPRAAGEPRSSKRHPPPPASATTTGGGFGGSFGDAQPWEKIIMPTPDPVFVSALDAAFFGWLTKPWQK